MKNKKLGQEPAFPFKEVKESLGGVPVNWTNHKGMSKRYVTAKDILCGLLANGEYTDTDASRNKNRLIELCYELTDELLKQENEGI